VPKHAHLRAGSLQQLHPALPEETDACKPKKLLIVTSERSSWGFGGLQLVSGNTPWGALGRQALVCDGARAQTHE
jgi:hypothetical protein